MKGSKRRYQVVTLDSCGVGQMAIDLGNLNQNREDYEFVYALADRIDDVLDLKPGESMYFQPNRDDCSSKGIIKRVI